MGAQGLGGRPDMLAARPAAGPAAEHPSSSVRQSSSYPSLRRASRGNNIDLRSTFGSSLKGAVWEWSVVILGRYSQPCSQGAAAMRPLHVTSTVATCYQ